MLNSTVLLVGSLVLGQAAGGSPTAYQQLKDQEIFIGDWEGNIQFPDTMPPDAPDWMKKVAAKNLTVRFSVNWGPEKGYQVIDTAFLGPGMSVKGTTLKVWDPAESKIKTFECSSMGGWREIIWTKQDAKIWKGKMEGVDFDGEEASEDQTLTLVDDDTFVVKATNRRTGGEPQPDIELTFKRVKPAAKPAK